MLYLSNADAAIWLLRKDRELAKKEEQNGLTCLHLLAKMPHVFRSYSEYTYMAKLKKFLYYCMSLWFYVVPFTLSAGSILNIMV